MIKILNKVISVAMACVVVLSTMSFIVDMHYCGDTLVDSAIFQKVKTCGMEMQKPSSKGCSIFKKNCCSDKQIVLDNQDELQLSFDLYSFEQHQFITSFLCSYINLIEGVEEDFNSYKDYTPPLVVRQIFKLDETYLI